MKCRSNALILHRGTGYTTALRTTKGHMVPTLMAVVYVVSKAPPRYVVEHKFSVIRHNYLPVEPGKYLTSHNRPTLSGLANSALGRHLFPS